ncbi:MAG: hypothetical protein RID91_15970 [Azospirillaceae bacterium]
MNGADLLRLWESGAGRTPLARAVLLAAAATGDAAPWDLPLPRRDRAILDLRRRLFGNRLPVDCACPACGARLETALDLSALDEATGGDVASDEEEATVTVASDVGNAAGPIRLRLPTSADLFAALAGPGPAEAARARLVARLAAPAGDGALSDAMLPACARALAEADPLIDPEIGFACPDCGADGRAPLDLPALVWAEIDNAARHLMHDIHDLARAYHWGEAAILALSPARRAAYLGMVRR